MSDWDKTLKEIYREFRDVRDWALDRDLDLDLDKKKIEDEAVCRLKKFWNDQPWYMRLFRRQIMRYVYRMYRTVKLDDLF